MERSCLVQREISMELKWQQKQDLPIEIYIKCSYHKMEKGGKQCLVIKC